MKVTELKYEYKKNVGNYEHEMVTATAIVEDNDKKEQCLAELKSFVMGSFSCTVAEAPEPIKEEVKEEPKKEAPKKATKKKATTPTKTTAKKAEPAEEVIEEEKEVEEKPAPAKKKATKKARVKATPYDRNNKLHKKLFGEVLKAFNPGWRDNSSLAKKASEASRELAGKDFLDSKGEVLPEFKQEIETRLQ